MRFNHYISHPKPTIETMMIKVLDRYPQKLKILEYKDYEYLILKYYGFVMIDRNHFYYGIVDDWRNNDPKESSDFFKEILRNR